MTNTAILKENLRNNTFFLVAAIIHEILKDSSTVYVVDSIKKQQYKPSSYYYYPYVFTHFIVKVLCQLILYDFGPNFTK